MSQMDVDIKRRAKQPKDENKPKAPMQAFFRFVMEKRDKVTDENPDLKLTEVTKRIGEMWGELSDSKKKPYQQAYKDEKLKYDKKLAAYKKTELWEEHQKVLKDFKMKQTKKPFPSDPNAPKRPLSGYMLFCNDKRPEIREKYEGQPATAMAKELSVMWGKTSEAQKAPYQKKAAKLKKEYDAEFEKYKKTKNYKEYQEAKEEYKKKQEATRIRLLGGKRAIARAEEERRIAEGRPAKKKVSGKKKDRKKMARKPKKGSSSKRKAMKRKADKKKSGKKKKKDSKRKDKKKKSSSKKDKKKKHSKKKKANKASRK